MRRGGRRLTYQGSVRVSDGSQRRHPGRDHNRDRRERAAGIRRGDGYYSCPRTRLLDSPSAARWRRPTRNGASLTYNLVGTDASHFDRPLLASKDQGCPGPTETTASYSVTVSVTDGKAVTEADTTADDTITVTITVTNQNEASANNHGQYRGQLCRKRHRGPWRPIPPRTPTPTPLL